MKGFFLVALLILGVSLIPLSAATSAGSGDENLSENGMGSAGVNINFDLSSEDNSSWAVGFTNDVTGLNNNGTSVTPLASDDVALKIDDTSGTLKENLYVYWIIKGGQQLDITLEADGALKEVAESGEPEGGAETELEYMNWMVSWKSSTSGSEGTVDQSLGTTDLYKEESDTNVYTTAQPVFERSVLDQSLETGSAQLIITTQDITDVAPVNYSANLTLKITPVETT